MNLKAVVFTTVALVWAQWVCVVDGECCPPPQAVCFGKVSLPAWLCYNCEIVGKSRKYCGIGSCNIFGCNCENGCIRRNGKEWCVQTNPGHGYHYCYDTMPGPGNVALNQLVSLVRPNFTTDPLDRNEFEQLVNRIHSKSNRAHALSQLNLTEEFAKLDTNSDGVLNLNEIDSDY